MFRRSILFFIVGILLTSGLVYAADPYKNGDSSICGDVNDDGIVNVFDVTEIIKCEYIPLYPPCELSPYVVDVNNDGLINIFDIVYLVSYLYKDGADPFCPTPPEPLGSMISASGCLGEKEAADTTSVWDCILYSYDGSGTLTLNQLNAGFNCCMDYFNADFDITDSTITITQYDEDLCDCNCLYNIDYEIINLLPGVYTITIDEPLPLPGEDILQFEIDLTSANSGEFCVRRYFYPWGF